MKHNTLRHYQLSHVNRILRQVSTHNEAALVSCVGSGKTLTASVVGSEAMNRGIVNRVICATPFTTIAEEFKRYTGSHWASNAQNNSQFTIRAIVEDEGVKHVADVVKCSDEFLVTTHAAMANKKVLKVIDEAEDLSGLLLMIDEAHHCFSSEDEEEDKDGTLLGVAARKILAKGGKVLYITATPYRNFGGTTNLIFDPNLCNPVVRTIGEQMREGLAPAMHVEYLHIQDMTLTNAGQSVLFGDGVSTRIGDTQLKHALPIIREKWITDGCPKAILIIPAGNSEHTAKAVASYFTSQGFPEEVATVRGRDTPNVLEAVGTDKQRILAGLTADKEACGHMFDLVIACRKFDEGTDVNTASHLYMIGLPSNVRLFHQRAGRVLRDKKGIPDYDAWFGTAWNEQSRVVFFAPAGKKTKEFDFKVGRQLLHCIFAAESYQEYCEALNFSQSIRIEFENEEVPEEDKSLVEDLMARLASIELSAMADSAKTGSEGSMQYQALVRDALNPNETVLDRVTAIKEDSGMTSEDKAKALCFLLNHLPEGALGSIDVAAMAKSLVATVKNKKFVKGGSAETFELNSSAALCEEFESVLKKFNSQKVASAFDTCAKKVYASLTGHDFQEWAERCKEFLGEEAGLSWVSQICDYMDTYDRTPSDKDTELGRKLSNLKQARKGVGKAAFYPSYETAATKRGYPTLFDMVDFEGRALEQLNKVFDFVEKEGREPSQKASNETEKLLGYKLSKFRLLYKGKGSGIFYESLRQCLASRGHSALFYEDRNETQGLKNLESICDFLDAHKKVPSQKSDDKEEARLGSALSSLRMKKKGGGQGAFYESYAEYIVGRGFPQLLETSDIIKGTLSQIAEVCDYMDSHGGKMPPRGSSTLPIRIRRVKRARKGDKGTWDDSFQQLAEDRGYPHLFDIVTPERREQNALQKTNDICSFMDASGHTPQKESMDVQERKLGNSLATLKGGKKGKSGCGVLYPSCISLSVERGYPDLFSVADASSREARTLVDIYEICAYIQKNGKAPPVLSRVGRVFRELRGYCKDGDSDKFLPSYQNKACALGHPDLFSFSHEGTKERESLMAINIVCDYYEKFGQLPKQNDPDKEVAKLASKGTWDASFAVLAADRGYPDLFKNGWIPK